MTDEEKRKLEEELELLKLQNDLLEKRVNIQSENYTWSSKLVDVAKIALGINSKNNNYDRSVLNLNQQISKALSEQRFTSQNINEIKKNINKNQLLINKAQTLEAGILTEINRKNKEDKEWDINSINYLKKKLEQLSRFKAEYKSLRELEDAGAGIDKNRLDLLERVIQTSRKVTTSIAKELSVEAALSLTLQEQLDLLNKQQETRVAELVQLEQVERKIGVFAGIIKGIGRIPILGDLIDTTDVIERARLATQSTGSGLKGLKAGLGELKDQFIEGLLRPTNMVLGLFTQMGLSLMNADKAAGDLAKSFDITYSNANKVRSTLTDIGNLSGDNAINTRALQENMIAMGSALGTNVQLNERDLVIMTKLAEKAGLTHDEMIGMQKMSLATGTSLETNISKFQAAAEIQATNRGVVLNTKQLLKETANVSDAIRLSVGGTGEGLGKAAAAAKALGSNLEQVDRIASSLLDFESSIQNEIQAEVLSGKQLNLEMARLYSFHNDIVGLSQELVKNIGTSAEFSKMNRLEQEAYAQAMGMSRDELATMLVKGEALKNMTGEQAKEAERAFDISVKNIGLAATQEKLAKDKMSGLMDQQSMQDRLNQALEKMKEPLAAIAEALIPILDVFAGILDVVGLIMKPLGAMMSWAGKMGGPLKSILTILTGMAAAAALFFGGLTGGLGLAAVLAAAGGAMAWLENKKKADDMVSSGYGKRTILHPEGSIALNDNDTIIAGTNLGQKNTSSTNNSINIDMQPLLQEVQAMKNVLNQLLNKETSIYLDGNKVGIAQNTGTNSFTI